MKKFLTLAIFSLIAVFLVVPVVSRGAAITEDENNDTSWPVLNSPDTGSCFDYYHFQSVVVGMGANKDSYRPGEKVTFRGNIINNNNYPVIDGYVFARISKKNKNYMQEGNFIVDEIVPVSKMYLNANEVKSSSFDWIVPREILSGDYRIDYFFSVGKKFNLGGLPFSNEVIVGTASFSIKEGTTSSVEFVRSGTKVNNQAYKHIGNWPIVEPGKSAVITQPLSNTSSASKEVSVTYDLFYWDSLNEADKISSKSETVVIPAKNTKILSYPVENVNRSVYYLRITAVAGSQKSIVNIRFTSEVDSSRLNYPAITKFPILKGEKATLFSCFHNTASSDQSGKVVVTLTDKGGKVIEKTEYSGLISPNMSVTKKDFTALEDYRYLKLSAQVLDKSGKAIDSYENVYDCDQLKFKQCKKPDVPVEPVKPAISGKIYLTVGLLLFIILLIITVMIKKGVNAKSNINNIVSVIVGLAILSVGASLIPRVSLAYNEQSTVMSQGFQSLWKRHCESPSDRLLVAGNVSVTHTVGMTSGDYGVKAGDPINFTLEDSSIFFDGVGHNWDTPYGFWCNDLTEECFANGYVNSPAAIKAVGLEVKAGSNRAYTTFTGVRPTGIYIVSSNPGVVNCSGMNCTALKTGTAKLTAMIPKTKTKIWTYFSTQGVNWQWAANNSKITCVVPGTNSCSGCTGGDQESNSLYFEGPGPSWDIVVGEKVLLEVPCIGGGCGGGSIGTSCMVSTNCQSGLCCNESGICSANCKGNKSLCDPECETGKICCSANSCKADCNCPAEPMVAGQQCCSDGIWRAKCTGCTKNSECATSRDECCDVENATCTTDQSYCVDPTFGLAVENDINIFLTANPGDHVGSTRVRINPAGGFRKEIFLSPVSTSPDDNLKNKMTNWLNPFTPGSLKSDKYSQGSVLTVKVPYDIIPAGTSKTYEMVIKGVADTIEKTKIIKVKIYGQNWVQP